MNSDSERMNGHLPEKDSGECAEKACENADDRDFGSEFVSDEILCGETEDDCRNGGKIVIAAQKNGGRLDAFAAEHTELTRSAVQRLLLCGAVTVNGRSEKAKYAVRMGDIIEIQLPPPVPTELVPQDIPIDIVYQDADIAVINKPVGMVVHPAPGNPDGTLCNALMFHLKDLSGIGGAMRPGLVHRIDKNTSGLLVIAKNDDAHNFLANELKTHSVARTYCALCEGNFRQDSGTVDAPLARHKTDRSAWRCTLPERPVRVKRLHIGSFANVSRTAARAEERFCGLNSKREGHTRSAFIWPISITRLSATMYTARVRHRQCAAGTISGSSGRLSMRKGCA